MNLRVFLITSCIVASFAGYRMQAGEGYTDTPMQPNGKWHVHDSNRPVPPVVTPGETFSLMAPAPSDAVVLFDGKDFSKWQGEKGDVKWKIEDGYMENVDHLTYAGAQMYSTRVVDEIKRTENSGSDNLPPR